MSSTVVIPEILLYEYRRLALAVANGDKQAETQLAKIEAKIADIERIERRREAAEAEATRVAAEAADQAAEQERADKAAKRSKLVADREAGFLAIEDAAASLVSAIKDCISIDVEVWSLSLQLGLRPDTRTKNRITDRINELLGREGAGLSDFTTPPPALRGPLARKES